MPRPSAAARPNISAVPEGASIFLLWCISRISTSKSSPSVLATRLVKAASTLTPMLKLPDLTITARLAASAISFSFSPERPVVPMTWTSPRLAASSTSASEAAGMVKSRSPSALASSGSTSAATITPFLPSPANSPESRPITAEPGASTAPASTTPSMVAIAWMSVRPMRPPAPATISRMSDIGSLPKSDAGIAGRKGYEKRPTLLRLSQRPRQEGQHAAPVLIRRIGFEIDVVRAVDPPKRFRLGCAGKHRSRLGQGGAIVERAGGDEERCGDISDAIDRTKIGRAHPDDGWQQHLKQPRQRTRDDGAQDRKRRANPIGNGAADLGING